MSCRSKDTNTIGRGVWIAWSSTELWANVCPVTRETATIAEMQKIWRSLFIVATTTVGWS
jgi:hypothetical protein